MTMTRRRALAALASAPAALLAPPLAAAGSIAPATPWRALAPDTVLTRVAFGSCLDQKKPQPIWTAVARAEPQLFLMLGDNVYGDIRSSDGAELIEAYRVQSAQPELAEARARMAFLATWDDHDYGLNDAGGEFAHRVLAARAFHEFWQRTPERAGEGIYTSRIFGPPGRRVQIILLDTRSFRSPLAAKPAGFADWGKYGPDPDPAKTMLGGAQWTWLAQELRVPADIRILCSSIQVLAEGHGFERWGNLPAERERLFALFRASGANGVVILSGDRHHGALYRRDDILRYPLFEMTSSPLNRPYGPSRDRRTAELASEIISIENFGLIGIDWVRRSIDIELRTLHGETAIRRAVAFADLGLD
jgi:alkaline phosphatase D